MNRFAAVTFLFFLFFVGSDAFNVTVSYVPTSAACLSFALTGLEYSFSIDQTPDGQYPGIYSGNTSFECTLTTHGKTFSTLPSSAEDTNFNFSFPLVAGDMTVTCEDNDIYYPYFDLNFTIPVTDEIFDDAVQELSLANECTNNSNGGSLTLVFPTSECTGATQIYTNCSWYSWEYNGSPFFSPTLNITGASAGFYQLTMLSNLGYCQKTFNYTILPPPSSVVSIAISPNKTSCPSATGGDGIIIVTPFLDQIDNDNAPIIPASWDLQIVNPDSGYNSNITISSIPAEVPIDYHFQQVYVTGYPTGYSHCYATSATIIQDVLSMNATTQPSLSCANTGSITLLPSGGNSPYTGFGISGGALSSNSVSSGERTVGVIDANGCNVSMIVKVNPTNQAISMGEVLSDSPTCHGQANGRATLYNVAPLTNTNLTVFLLRTSNPFSLVQTWNAVYGEISNFTGNSLMAGSYKFVVRDVCGNMQSSSFSLTNPPQLIVHSIVVQPKTSCTSSGWISGIVGSNQPLLGSYLVQVMLMSTVPWLTALPFDTPAWNVSGLGVGIYTVTVTSDNTGCVASKGPVGIGLAAMPVIVGVSVQSASCFDQADATIDLTVSGAGPVVPYVDGVKVGSAGYQVVSATLVKLLNVGGGQKVVSITDKYGCPSVSRTVDVPVTSQAQLAVVAGSLTPSTCGGISPTGAVDTRITGEGGCLGGYLYQWSDLGDVLTTEGNRSDLVAGRYQVRAFCTVNGVQCATTVAAFTIAAEGESSLTVGVSGGLVGPLCRNLTSGFGTEVTGVLGGDFGPFQVVVRGDDGLTEGYESEVTVSTAGAFSVQVPQAGKYLLEVTDGIGCLVYKSLTVAKSSVGLPDADVDGVCDGIDNCPLVFNPWQLDSDGDSVGDVCDVCPYDPNNGDSDGDGVPDCRDGCPHNSNLTSPTICGCYVLSQCDCDVLDICEDIAYSPDNSTASFSGNNPTVVVSVTNDKNQTILSVLEWSSLTEIDGEAQKQDLDSTSTKINLAERKVINRLNFTELKWRRSIRVGNTSVYVIYTALHQQPWPSSTPNCTLKVQLTNEFSSSNTTSSYDSLDFYFTTASNKFSLLLSGCWGFSDVGNLLVGTFRFALPNGTSYTNAPTDCSGEIAAPDSGVVISQNHTDFTGYQTVSFYTNDGAVIQSQVLSSAVVDGQRVQTQFATKPLVGEVILIFPSFDTNLSYDPTLSMLFGSNGDDGSCKGISVWLPPLIGFGVAIVAIIVVILLVLYFPPASALFFGKEGGRVQNVRRYSAKYGGRSDVQQEAYTPDIEASSTASPPAGAAVTTADW